MNTATEEQNQILLEAEENRKRRAAELAARNPGPSLSFAGLAFSLEETLSRFEKLTPRQAQDMTAEEIRKTSLRRELLQKAEIPELHAALESVSGDEWIQAFERTKEKLGTGFIVALIGLRGTGKTQMGANLIEANCMALRPSRFTLAMDIFLAIKACYRRDATISERQVVEEFCRPKLLVIDEIQERAETPFEDRILTHLINRRYNDQKDTLLIGNLTPEQFTESMGPSIVRRLNETGGLIECNWGSFRK